MSSSRVESAGLAAALLAATVTAAGLTGPAAAHTSASTAPVAAFQAAGEYGGGVLEPGSVYPPARHGTARLRRGSDWVRVRIRTSGLPEGAYTVWWVVFDTPAGCVDGCGVDDLFNPDASPSVFFATGGVVGKSGAKTFSARHRAGASLGEPGSQHVLGDGALDPDRAEIHNVIKYHGPAASDPAAPHEQTHTLLGGCFEGANAIDHGPPFGVQCFDPQAVAHPLP